MKVPSILFSPILPCKGHILPVNLPLVSSSLVKTSCHIINNQAILEHNISYDLLQNFILCDEDIEIFKIYILYR